MCPNLRTPKNNKFSIWNKWKIYCILVSQYLSTLQVYEISKLLDFDWSFLGFPAVQVLAYKDLGRVVQSIVSLMSSLRGQLVKCFMTL